MTDTEQAAAKPAPATGRHSYLDTLNPAQREAVETLEGPVLVLAGAGTGKTRVLTTRLGHLLTVGQARPWQVLAVTFTNKAAREMRDRVGRQTGAPTDGWWLGTFHSIAARILRRHAELVGLTGSFTILDTDDQLRLIKQLLEAENVDHKRWPARLILSAIERWKDRALTPDKLKPEDAGDLAGGRMLALYRAYQDRLRTLNACDFGDLLQHCLTLFAITETVDGQTRFPVLEQYQDRFRYILVDEYQDTNQAQYFWLRLLAQHHRNLCCVGDDDQSIYSWRGAEIGNILRFESDFPGAKVIRLEQNYRSTARILSAASALIAHNQGRLGKTLYCEGAVGDPIVARTVWDGEEEARWVVDEIEALERRKVRLGDIAILVRAGYQMRELEDRLITVGVRYRVVGGPRFYERREIRDALAYLRVVAQPADDLAFERIINVPRRGIGATTIRTISALARRERIPMTEAVLRLLPTDELTGKARRSLGQLMQDFERWRAVAESRSHTDLARIVLDESGYTAMWQSEKTVEAQGRLENLKELVAGMEEFESLAGFLEHVSLVMEAVEAGDAEAAAEMVTLMTLHAAKGLEFGHVFLPGWEEGVFPSQRSMDETGVAGLEEERRLAYVGLTRAKDRAYVSCAARRRIYGMWQDTLPSRFLSEIPVEHLDRQSDMAPATAFEGSGYRGLFEASRQAAVNRRGPPMLDDVAYTATPRPRPERPYDTGHRVFHEKFGPGTVRLVDADKLTIEFDHAGEKKVMDSFVVPLDRAP